MSKIHINDFKLWAAVRNDDRSAFNILFDRYWERLFRLASDYLKDHEACEEVVHDIFLNIWSRRKELEIRSFSNFLLTAARYHIYNRMRSAKLAVVYIADYENLDRASERNIGEDQIRQLELQNELNQHLDQLPQRCHQIFRMSRMEHLSNEEIAHSLGISKRSVENQLALALKHLKHCYKNLAVVMLTSLLL